MPSDRTSWRAALARWRRDTYATALSDALAACASHPGLGSYKPVVAAYENRLGMNRFTHDAAIDLATALLIGRLACGGQGCRGGDPAEDPPVSIGNCCLYCLEQKQKALPETLAHLLLFCPLAATLRETQELAGILAAGLEILHYHRARWSWRELRCIRTYVAQVWQKRCQWNARFSAAGRRRLNERLSDAWHAFVDSEAICEVHGRDG